MPDIDTSQMGPLIEAGYDLIPLHRWDARAKCPRTGTMRERGKSPINAIVEATKNRLRPIFMSTLTSIFGMLPLVLFPGPGSELYRGLGSVVIGGLSLSAVLTLLLIPPLLALVLRPAAFLYRRPGSRPAASPAE